VRRIAVEKRRKQKSCEESVAMHDPEHESLVLFPLEKGCVRVQVRHGFRFFCFAGLTRDPSECGGGQLGHELHER
jgi:hypothetical protein